MQQRSLGDLRKELQDRLGQSAQTITPANKRLLNSFLREAHDFVMMQYTWPELKRDWVFDLVPGNTMYQLPTDACGYTPDDLRFISVHVKVAQQWGLPMPCGIDPELYTETYTGIPRRYDISHGDGGVL